MATVKMTFSLDEGTSVQLRQLAKRLDRPQSEIVREAISEYGARVGRLSEGERARMLRIFDELVPRIPDGPVAEVEEELAELRRARSGGGRATPAGKR